MNSVRIVNASASGLVRHVQHNVDVMVNVQIGTSLLVSLLLLFKVHSSNHFVLSLGPGAN